ncbi:MAG: hypothetical protein ACO1TE_23580 [Prosthecobacter sp.]
MLPWLACALLLLPSCVVYDPDYGREAAFIQDTDYPANTIVGEWMQVGNGRVGGFMYEKRVYVRFNADGTGRNISSKLLPPIYNQYKDLYNGPKDFSGEETLESSFSWKYLGKNKWEYVFTSPSRFVTRAPWMTSYPSNELTGAKNIVRYHNGKLFFPQAHSTAVSTKDIPAVKAKLATIRAITDDELRSSLEADRVQLQYQRSLQNSGYLQPQYGMPPSYNY